MAKAKKSLKGLGARYGIKLRKQYTKVHFTLKQKRNALLTACDWTVGADSPLSDAKKGEWQTYRQALRDFDYASVTQDFGIVWPTPPQ